MKPSYWIFIGLIVALTLFQAATQLYLPKLMQNIVDNGIVKGNVGFITHTGFIMIIVSLVGIVCAITGTLLAAKVSMSVGMDLRRKVFQKATEYSLAEFDQLGVSTMITRNTNDVTQVQTTMFMILRMMLMAPFMLIGGLILAIRQDASLSVIIAIIIPSMILLVLIVAKMTLPLFDKVQKRLDKLNLVLREKLIGIRVIKAFNKTRRERERFDEANRQLTDVSLKVNRIVMSLLPVVFLLINFSTLAVIWFGGLRIDKGLLEIGGLMAYIQYLIHIMISLVMVAVSFVMVPRAKVSLDRIMEALEIESTLKDPVEPAGFVDESGHEKRGTVEFRDVSFAYANSKEDTVSGITFLAGPGEITAIIGGTGSGKTTLVNLIPRFYDATGGEVLIDGVNVRDVSQGELRRKISFVPQKALLFSGTVAGNIRMGKQDATDDEVIHAATVAQAHDFISRMEKGYDSLVAQGGTNLSGGQKQRLTIARALVRRPEIYVFDDNFSALDFKTYAKLRTALKKETTQSTVLVVAQLVSTVMDADRIIVLDDGKVAGLGTHKQLVKENEVYREIVASQLSKEALQ